MAIWPNDLPMSEWQRQAFRDLSASFYETELRQLMEQGLRRSRFVRALFPPAWQVDYDTYSFTQHRAVLTVTAPSSVFPY